MIIRRAGADHLNLIERGKRTIISASKNQGLLTDDSATFKVSSASVLDIKINDTININGEVYRLNTLPSVEKNTDSSYEYTIVAQGIMYDLLRCKFFNADALAFKTDTEFPLIGNIELFLNVVKNNMQRFSPLWEVGTFVNGDTKMITFGDDSCLSALQKICQEFKIEFWVKQEAGKFKIHTGNFGSTLPVTFEFGKGKGLYNLTRNNVNDNDIVTRLYVSGGADNIPNGYRNFSTRLKLPTVNYLEDTALTDTVGLKEGTIVFDSIYPKRTGTVTALGDTKFKFSDSAIDFDLNEKEADGITTKYLVPGTSAKIHFQTGNLAGYEFEIKKGGYNHATKTFEIIPFVNDSGQKFPDPVAPAFQISTGDTYVILDIVMPQTYIDEAENELLTKATEQFLLLKQAKVSYGLSVDPEFIKNLATPLQIGDLVRVIDTGLGINKVIRITDIVNDFITGNAPTPFNYKITIADDYEVSFSSQMILEIKDIKNIVNLTNLGQINYSQIGLKTTQELQNMVFDTDDYFNPENIKPNSIETNMLTVGSQSQQLSSSVIFVLNKDGDANLIEQKAGVIYSQTFDKAWNISAKNFTFGDNSSRYVYGKCSKTGAGGEIIMSSAQIKFDEDPNDYYFLIGILHSVIEGIRILSITIGTTTINGGLIRTGTISSLDGQTFFNLDTGQIAGKITFLAGSNFDQLLIGGKNLYLNSSVFQLAPNNTGFGTSVLRTDETDHYYRATPNAGLATSVFGMGIILIDGKDYIMGLWVRHAHSTTVNIKIYQHEGDPTGEKITSVLPDTWTFIKSNLITGTGVNSFIILQSETVDVPLDYKKAIIIQGNILPNDWVPAPEDIQSQIFAQTAAVTDLENKTDFLTETAISGNSVATGTLLVGSDDGANGGITGIIDPILEQDSVSLWFGKTFADRGTAPFRVTQSGKIALESKNIAGQARGLYLEGENFVFKDENNTVRRRISMFDFKNFSGNGTLLWEVDETGFHSYAVAESYVPAVLSSFGNTYDETATYLELQELFEYGVYVSDTEIGPNKWRHIVSVSGNSYYQYFPGNVVPANLPYEGYKYTQVKTNTLADGWYSPNAGQLFNGFRPPTDLTASVTIEMWYLQGGKKILFETVTITI